MLKNRKLLGILLSIIMMLAFSIGGYAFYDYTQESGVDYFVGTADKSDALEDCNENRMILDAFGQLLGHSKYNTTYPADGDTTVGTLQIPEAGLKFGNDPVNNGIAAYVGGEMSWQTKAELSLQPLDTALTNISGLTYVSPSFLKLTANDTYAVRTIAEVKTDLAYSDAEIKAILVDEVTKTGAFTAGKIAKINNATGIIEEGTNTDNDVADAVIKKHSQNTDTDLDATFEATFVKKADTVNVLSDITSPGADIENAVTKKHTQNTDTAAGGEWNFGAYSAGFTIQTTTGDGTTTIDWRLGNKFKFTFGTQNETFTFIAPTNPCTLMLTLIQDGTGSRTVTWPETVKWPGGIAPTLTTTPNARDKVALDWDGTQYDGQCAKDFK